MKAFEANHFVLSIGLKKDKIENYEKYPFCLPIVKNLKEIKLHEAVTYIVGENGSK
jgi:predicted ATPase